MNTKFRGAKGEGWGALGGDPAKINLKEGKTKFRGTTEQGRTAVDYRERSGPRRLAERRDLGKAHGQWKVGGGWKVSLREGQGSREGALSRETEGPGRLKPILRRRGQR